MCCLPQRLQQRLQQNHLNLINSFQNVSKNLVKYSDLIACLLWPKTFHLCPCQLSMILALLQRLNSTKEASKIKRKIFTWFIYILFTLLDAARALGIWLCLQPLAYTETMWKSVGTITPKPYQSWFFDLPEKCLHPKTKLRLNEIELSFC